MSILEQLNKEGLRTDIPNFNIGDTIKVNYKVIEGGKERIQAYEGTVIAKKNSGIKETVKVRRISAGIGVERTFPIHSPRIASIEVIRAGKVRRAKLYYLRKRTGKATKTKAANVNQ